jgi:hypothetical protein
VGAVGALELLATEEDAAGAEEVPEPRTAERPLFVRSGFLLMCDQRE